MMAILPVAPTKSNLMAVKTQLAVARDGYDLLEQKREILVMELMARLAEVKSLEQELTRRQETAYPALKELLFERGREKADAISQNFTPLVGLTERKTIIAGLSFSVLESAPCEGSVGGGQTRQEFSELLILLAQMASLRAVVVRLALEVKKTQRRVNALEKIVIPQTEETKTYIEHVLEEQEREAFFVRKLLKARVETNP